MANMSFDKAKEQLRFHCGTDSRIDDPRWKAGFLSSLRPYAGLNHEAMRDVRRCFEGVKKHLAEATEIDREVISSLWGIVHLGRAWALDPGGMLQRNDLISDVDTATLTEWIEDLSFDICMVLDRTDESEA